MHKYIIMTYICATSLHTCLHMDVLYNVHADFYLYGINTYRCMSYSHKYIHAYIHASIQTHSCTYTPIWYMYINTCTHSCIDTSYAYNTYVRGESCNEAKAYQHNDGQPVRNLPDSFFSCLLILCFGNA